MPRSFARSEQVDNKLTAAKAAIKTKEQLATEEAKKLKAAAAAAEKEMLALLRASIKQPRLEAGVDPKSVVCEFFKAGACEKGERRGAGRRRGVGVCGRVFPVSVGRRPRREAR